MRVKKWIESKKTAPQEKRRVGNSMRLEEEEVIQCEVSDFPCVVYQQRSMRFHMGQCS